MDFALAPRSVFKKMLVLLLLVSSALITPMMKAQDVAGMTGEVTDASGALVAGAVVTLTNKTTGVKFTQTTSSSGVYRFSEIPPGQGYEAVFTATGFSPLDVKDIYLTVASVRTQNATLSLGANVEVEVTASNSEVTIDTTDATVGNTFDVKLLNELPVQQRNDPTALFTMQPGVTDTGSVTGARVDQNYITLDGLDVNDLATGGAVQNASGITEGFSGTIVGHAPIDSVEEFHGTVAGLASGNNTASGGQFQLVTKSGTNQFHGNINEYHRDPSLAANSWFNNNATPIVPRNHLIQNQFGGNIGGPIMKNKLFFFFDYNNSRTIAAVSTNRTVPLSNLRNGIIDYINNAGGDNSQTIGSLTPAQVRALDPAGIGEDATWLTALDARFPLSNAAGGDGINSGGYTFNAPNNDYETNYVGRVDYNLNQTMSVFARFTIARENATINVNEFAGDPPTDPFIDRTYAFVLGHNWVIGANKTNRVFLGETVEKYYYPNQYNPGGANYFTFGDGADLSLASGLYLQPSTQSRRIPVPVIGDDFSVTKGGHTWQMGGTFKDIKAQDNSSIDYNTTEIGLGGYVFSLCGPTAGDCGGTNPSLRPSDIDQGPNFGATASGTYDEAFAFMLGRIADVSSDYNYNLAGQVQPQLSGDHRIYRYYQTQLYASDSWKATPSLTLTYGVTYQYFSVPYETRGYESVENYGFNQYMQARLAASSTGELGPTAAPLITYSLGGKANNGPPLYQPEWRNLAPHVAFAINPSFDKKTVFNGSVGVVYDRTVINAIQQIQDSDSYLFQQSAPTTEGIPGDPYDSIKTDPRLDSSNGLSNAHLVAPPSPKAPYQPFNNLAACEAQGFTYSPCGLQNGLDFNATIDPNLKTPYSISFNGGVQHQFGWNTVLKVNYAGRLGRRLLAQEDANQILEYQDPVSGELYSQAFEALTQAARAGANPLTLPAQPFFENVFPAGLGVSNGYTNTTDYIATKVASQYIHNGDFGDFTQAISDLGAPANLGSAAQFSENTFYSNGASSAYNALLLTLQKNLSHGLQYDLNYTFSHSIDNVSFFANSEGDTGIGGVGLVCDYLRPRECRADSDFDVRQYITGDAVYELPFGRGKMFLGDAPFWMNEVIGGWSLSGVVDWHTGQAWGTAANAFDASYSNDAPAILIGSKSTVAPHLTKLAGGGVNTFKAVPGSDPAAAESSAYEGPLGFTIGARNSLHGPHFFDADTSLAKTFPIYAERVNLKFRADAFNLFNHPNFGLPQENAFNGFDQQDFTNNSFGQISDTVTPAGNLNNGARVLQVSLRLEF